MEMNGKAQMIGEKQQRQIAYKVWIGDLLAGEISFNGDYLSFVSVKNKKVSRVNLIANVVDKFVSETKPYTAFTLDDGTGKIRAKLFETNEKIKKMQIGDTLLLIGVLRFFNNEVYISPEIIKTTDTRLLLLRKLELEQEYGERDFSEKKLYEINENKAKPMKEENFAVEEEKIDVSKKMPESETKTNENKEDSIKGAIINLVAKNEGGIDIDNLIMSVNFPVASINSAISELIDEGKIYEPQPGKLRSM